MQQSNGSKQEKVVSYPVFVDVLKKYFFYPKEIKEKMYIIISVCPLGPAGGPEGHSGFPQGHRGSTGRKGNHLPGRAEALGGGQPSV